MRELHTYTLYTDMNNAVTCIADGESVSVSVCVSVSVSVCVRNYRTDGWTVQNIIKTQNSHLFEPKHTGMLCMQRVRMKHYTNYE